MFLREPRFRHGVTALEAQLQHCRAQSPGGPSWVCGTEVGAGRTQYRHTQSAPSVSACFVSAPSVSALSVRTQCECT